jgi:hypothetical protein
VAGVVLALLRQLDPSRDLAAAASHGRSGAISRFEFGKLWLAFVIENAVIPWCMLWARVSPYVTWAGVRYRKAGGRVRVAGLEAPH